MCCLSKNFQNATISLFLNSNRIKYNIKIFCSENNLIQKPKICTVDRENTISVKEEQKRLSKFHYKNFKIEGAPRTKSPVAFDSEADPTLNVNVMVKVLNLETSQHMKDRAKNLAKKISISRIVSG